ncbi:hypothetical protein EVAR_84155_1 [Eumeta japonica]|uniref:Uncharacterized protein n=1 Tax=Eumeta variegata TaxID=151549 RepID=A0A4C2AAP6_EUMVA|nr:hypothetical protein EVAR_84155_1 [Eumeta japonica]
MSTRRVTKGASTSKSEREPNVPKGGPRVGTVAKNKIVSQKIMTTPPVPCTPPETAGDGAKYSHEKSVRGTEDVPNDESRTSECSPPWKRWRLRQTGEPQRRNRPLVCPRRETDASGPVQGYPRPEPRDSRSVRLDAHPLARLASIGTLAMEARGELEGLRNISRDVKESVIGKLAAISELALRLEESRSSYIMELEMERARRAREAEAAEKRIAKIAKENLDRILQIENKIDKMAGEVSSTRNLLGHFDVPEKLEAIQKTLEAGTAPRAPNYAKVVTKLRSVVDAREIGVAVDRLRKARNQKVVVSCSSAEDAKKIEERLKMRGADLRVSKPEKDCRQWLSGTS